MIVQFIIYNSNFLKYKQYIKIQIIIPKIRHLCMKIIIFILFFSLYGA